MQHRRPAVQAWQAALSSLIIPGSGQLLLGATRRGVTLLVAIILLGILVVWRQAVALAAPLAGIWLWGVWDAWRLGSARRRGASLALPVLLGALIVYGLGMQAVEMQPTRLVTGWPKMQPYLRAMLRPELLTRPTHDIVGLTPFQVPCIDPLPAPDKSASAEPRVTTNVSCAAIDDSIEVTGEGFLPNVEAELWWINPIGDRQRLLENSQPIRVMTDKNGRFAKTVVVPLAIPLTSMPPAGQTQTHVIRAEQHEPYGSLEPTETLALVLDKIGETVALAFLATVLGVILAVPVSFLAARNLMGGNRVTLAIYYVVRGVLNIVRSIETLIWAIILAAWVGLGPFNGTLALLIHTVAALGKLYSEAIESIDPGPIEAVRATGANWAQVVIYAVLPQITPTFLSFTLYRWDINVRMSTVIGLVSNAGLGFLVVQWIRLNRFSSMATALIAIVLVVAILDYVSAWGRERILVGVPAGRRPGPVRRFVTSALVLAVFAAGFAWSWRVAEIDFGKLLNPPPEALRLLRDFAIPEMFGHPSEEVVVTVPLTVPCGAVEAPSSSDTDQVVLSAECGNVGDPLVIEGRGLPADTEVSVRWFLPDGAFLRVQSGCCTTDASGSLRLETKIHALMEVEEGQAAPSEVAIAWQNRTGGLRFSNAFNTSLDLAVVTLFMGLVATTLGALMAIPASFPAARNITGHGPIGSAIYHTFRTTFNLTRSVEPMILALICAAWVGVGPFAGMVALALWNVPNLAKLFSETIEEIDPGPVEAVTATGANRFQTLIYAIVPQLVPKFLAFILYQWDINLRMSTVIGFVGGGGIGQWLREQIQLNQYGAAGMATWFIVAMVWTMDYLSAKAREKLV